MRNDDEILQDEVLQKVFSAYREACPEPEASPNFMPALWTKIDGRRGFVFVFGRFARTGTAAAAAFCLLLLLLNFSTAPSRVVAPTYADALAADSQANAMYGDLARALPLPEGSR